MNTQANPLSILHPQLLNAEISALLLLKCAPVLNLLLLPSSSNPKRTDALSGWSCALIGPLPFIVSLSSHITWSGLMGLLTHELGEQVYRLVFESGEERSCSERTQTRDAPAHTFVA